MIQSEVSGVCFTVHPVTKDKNQMVIEAVWGLGEILVSGQITPDTYVVEKDSLNLLDVNRNPQEKMIIQAKISNKQSLLLRNKTVTVSAVKKKRQKLSEKQIKGIAKICAKIESHYKNLQDIEWALAENKFYILQSRPITGL
jgi:pyruvate,water dikinase